jgi:anaerobic sulfite reductase subunit B
MNARRRLMDNLYKPFNSKIIKIIKHTDLEYTFKMEYAGDVKPGQFFEVSIPKLGEAPISVSGIGDGFVDLTIRRVGKVTNEIFENYEGSSFFMRGPYGNGFDIGIYKGKQLVIVAGGTGVSPVRHVIEYFSKNSAEVKGFNVIVGFKSPADILFKDDIKEWAKNKDFILTVDKGGEGYSGNEGMVTKYIPGLPINDVNDVQVIVVGPPIMMKFAVEAFLKRNVPEENIWISHERRMCCGLGKCGHCRINEKYVCIDGPVFNYSEGKLLVD